MRKGHLWAVVVALIFCAAIVLGGCGETTEAEKVDDPAGGSGESAPAAEAFAVGDTVKMGDLQITVNSARWEAGNEFAKPDAGERWLVVDSTLENLGDESEAISSVMMFNLYDEESYSCEQGIFAETKGSLDGELGPGRKMRGEIAYTVAEDQSAWELVFEPNVFGFGQAVFDIAAEDVQ